MDSFFVLDGWMLLFVVTNESIHRNISCSIDAIVCSRLSCVCTLISCQSIRFIISYFVLFHIVSHVNYDGHCRMVQMKDDEYFFYRCYRY